MREEAFRFLRISHIPGVVRSSQVAHRSLHTEALQALDLQTAVRVSRHTGDCKTVMALEHLIYCEDKNLLRGHVAVFLKQYDLAQDLLLSSTQVPMATKPQHPDALHP